MLVRKIVSHFHDRFWRAPQGLGRPISAEAWDRSFASDRLDHLSDISEAARYAVIRDYAVRLMATPAILDVGCGAGLLRAVFEDKDVSAYKGIDLSKEAVRMATARGFTKTAFEAADFDLYEADPATNLVIFNESIYYALEPDKTFERYWNRLPGGGAVIVSIHDYDLRSRACWRRLERRWKPDFSTRLTNEQEKIWDVRVFLKGPR